ncbi:MAG: HlyD family efflux transporter periplasmic adaptor subunit [Planctomycetales bacterium]|nr:HlyD family efflux transporter periplasmic adaptor subunit [Planctomycetales bacterium]
MSTEQPVDPNAVEETKLQIRGLVSEITQLSRQNLEPAVFYGEFLQRVLSALAAVGGAVWIRNEGSGLELANQINLRASFPNTDGDSDDLTRHARLLHRVVQSGEELLVPPFSGPPGDEEAGNPTAYLLVLVPIQDDQNIAGVVEIFQRANTGPASQRGYLRFLSEMCVLVGDYLKGRRLRQLNDWQSLFSKVDRFSRTVHEGLDPKTTAYTIANEGRRLIGCDRVSVALRKGTRCKIEAVSGQDTMDTRASSVVLLGKLATAVMRSGDPLWYTGNTDDLPPQIERAVHDYVDETHTKSVAVLPLRRPMKYIPDGDETKRKQAEEEEGEVIGTLIVEQIEDNRPPEEFASSVDLVTEHSSRALANSMEHNNLFLMPVWRTIGNAAWVLRARTLPKTLAIAAAVLALVLAMFLVPWDFEMKCKGALLPVQRQDVFNLEDGTVMEVDVEHGSEVGEGQELANLRNSALDVEISRVMGEIDTTQKQREAIVRQLRDSATLARMSRVEQAQTASEKFRLEAELKSLNQQLVLLRTRRDNLVVKSPMAGEIMTWDVKKLLERRPVSKGDVLMTVVNPDGPWELELYVPESKIGHILQNPPPDGGPWKVRYILKSNPKIEHVGTIREIHNAAQLHEEHGHSVRVVVDIDKQDFLGADNAGEVLAKPGTEVTAKVYCGRRPVGYALFHELFETIQSRLFF